MSIPFPSVGSLVYTTFLPDTVSDAMNGINGALVAAGWTSTATQSTATLTITIPANNVTCVIAGVTYTFQTTLNNAVANNIKIASTATLQAQYIADAINNGSGGGTEWSTPTVANPVVTAVASGTSLTLTSVGFGTSGGSSFSVTGFGNATSQGNGFICQCAMTPQGLQANVYIANNDGSGNTISVWFGSADGSLQSGGTGSGYGGRTGFYGSLTITSGRTLKIRADAHSFWVWLTGDKSSQGVEVGMLVPYLRSGQTAVQVSNVSNNGGLIQITTSSPHGLTTGQSVSEFGILGVPANGVFTVTVIDALNYTLNSSVFSGAYTSGGSVGGSGGAGGSGGISRCFIGWYDYSANSSFSARQPTWRNRVATSFGFYCINEFSYGNSSNNNILAQLMGNLAIKTPGLYLTWGGLANSNEAQIGWPGTSASAVFRVVGSIWGALCVMDSVPMDEVITGYLGHNWINMTDLDGEAALFLTTS